MKKWLLILPLLLIVFGSSAQLYIEPIAGYGTDLNNKLPGFNLLVTGVQLEKKTLSGAGWLFRFDVDYGTAAKSSDSSFTTNAALPVFAPADKSIRPVLYNFSTGLRLKAVKLNKTNHLLALLYAGVSWQKFNVDYTYRKSDYSILNPDINRDVLGIFLSGGIEYMHEYANGRFFADALISTPPAKKDFSPSTFRFSAPLTFTVGYSFIISKKNTK